MRRLAAVVCITLAVLASCTPAVATTEARTTETAPRPACAAPTWPYSVVEVQRWWNCGHDPNIDRARAAALTAWLNAHVDNQLRAYAFAAYLAATSSPTTCTEARSCAVLVRSVFAARGLDGNDAVRVMMCESGGNPNAYNPSSGASGLFQQLARYWQGRAAAYGVAGRSPFDPWANAVVSAGMVRDTGGWSHWSCRP